MLHAAVDKYLTQLENLTVFKTIFLRIMILPLGVLMGLKSIESFRGLSTWIQSWMSGNHSPMQVVGKIRHIDTQTGKWHSGEEYIYLKNENKEIIFEADLTVAKKQEITALNNSVRISYVPVPIGHFSVLGILSSDGTKRYFSHDIKWKVIPYIGLAAFILDSMLLIFSFFLFAMAFNLIKTKETR